MQSVWNEGIRLTQVVCVHRSEELQFPIMNLLTFKCGDAVALNVQVGRTRYEQRLVAFNWMVIVGQFDNFREILLAHKRVEASRLSRCCYCADMIAVRTFSCYKHHATRQRRGS